MLVCCGFLSGAFALSAHAERYQGNSVEVIDQIGMNHADVVLGIDPEYVGHLLRKDMRINIEGDWRASLTQGISLADLKEYPIKGSKNLFISSPATRSISQATASIKSAKYADALRYTKEALAKAPDNPRSLALKFLLEDLIKDAGKVTQTARNFDATLRAKDARSAVPAYDAYDDAVSTFLRIS